ncbi:GNAT family N-acetyltransferase [Pseudoroseomonas globiformis]|uniref:GNAT family N-acetyltransferase n=1 Tax=Teichococcus globiformis TaxID=2307229 RepID=A0ABV7G624_9PROT
MPLLHAECKHFQALASPYHLFYPDHMAPFPLRFETLRGAALMPHLPDLAGLRIAVFREWPYLYEGDEAYEARYLRAYAEGEGAAVMLCRDGDRPVGISTCEPMGTTHQAVRACFLEAGLDPGRFCYFGESVLLQPYRGRGAGLRFFKLREAHARSLGADYATFCAVEREVDDPRRPAGYLPLDGFWQRRGYTPYPSLRCVMNWREPGGRAEIPHHLSFWIKPLSEASLP